MIQSFFVSDQGKERERGREKLDKWYCSKQKEPSLDSSSEEMAWWLS